MGLLWLLFCEAIKFCELNFSYQFVHSKPCESTLLTGRTFTMFTVTSSPYFKIFTVFHDFWNWALFSVRVKWFSHMILSAWKQIRWVFEPPHDKTNKIAVRPRKTQISLGIHPVWSESSLCAQLVAKDPSFFMRTAKTLIRLGMTKPTKLHVRPAKTQISLGIRPVWSVFALRSVGS